MKGFPKVFKTKRDLKVGVSVAKDNPIHRGQMQIILKNVRDNTTMLVMKKSSEEKIQKWRKEHPDATPEEEQEALNINTEDDYELVPDPNCMKNRIGITDDELNAMIKELA